MCGIFGEVRPRPPGIDKGLLKRATDLVRHRGPDGCGFLLVDGRTFAPALSSAPPLATGQPVAGLGHRRLSIIDLSEAAAQPMGTGEGDLWITYNGEIFNYIELREELRKKGHVFRTASDTEVILHAYREWGEGCLSRFNGMWAFGLLDLRRRVLFCARDRMGIKPFYYHCDGNRFLFGSEIKQLLADPGVSRELHPGVAYDFLVHGLLDHSDKTFFKSVRQLRGGEFLMLPVEGAPCRPVIRRYWGIDPSRTASRATDAKCAAQFLELLEDSVRLRLRSDVPVGSCLSGGLDSSAIVCLVNRILKQDGTAETQNTFSSCFEDLRYDERRFIDQVTAATGVKSRYVFPDPDDLFEELGQVLWHQDEPFGSTSVYAQWCVFRLAKEAGVKVMLDGQGADELLGGYHEFFPPALADILSASSGNVLARMVRGLRHVHRKPASEIARMVVTGFFSSRDSIVRLARRVFPRTESQVLDPVFLRTGQRESEYRKIPARPGCSRFRAALHEAFFHTSLPGLLHYEDRNSMAHSVESRVPFLDYRLVEFAFSLPDDQKIRGPVTKYVLRNAMRGILPNPVNDRVDKMGFVTPEEWWLKERLGKNRQGLKGRAPSGIFVRRILDRKMEDILSGRIPFSFAPWRWLGFSLWNDGHMHGGN